MSPINASKVFVFSLWAADLALTAHFYRDVIGLRPSPHHGGRVAFELGNGAHLGILQGQARPMEDLQTDPFPAIAFQVAYFQQLRPLI